MKPLRYLTQKDLALTWSERLTINMARRSAAYLFSKRKRISSQWYDYSIEFYGEHEEERFQVFPTESHKTPIVFIHGGGWVTGHMRSVAIGHGHFVREGFPLFNLNYPLAPEHPFPQPLISCLKALHFLRANNPACQAVHIMGDSAGANLAAMCALLINNPEVMQRFELSFPELNEKVYPEIVSLTSIYGVMDRLSWTGNRFYKLIMKAYGGKHALETKLPEDLLLSPMDAEWQYCPPVFLACAEKDVITASSKKAMPFFERIADKHQLKIYPGVRHGFYEDPGARQSKQLKKDIQAFLENCDSAVD